MTRLIALHGATGSGKTTLIRQIQVHFSTDYFIIQENLDELLATSSSDDDQVPWQQRTTAISASDNVTHSLVEKLNPLFVIIFTLIVYFVTNSVWPVILLFICSFAICRFCRWLISHMLSKMWLYNVFLFSRWQLTSNCHWIWRDRTCVDIYAYCMLNKATSVPSNMPAILLEQTRTTSVAIILDVPRHSIEKHLRTRIHAPTTSRSLAFATRLILLTQLPIRASIDALTLVERWYTTMNVPVIKISQLTDKLDYDSTTGDIKWSKHSISVLLETVEEAIQQRGQPSPTIDESLMPWQIVRNSRLFRA